MLFWKRFLKRVGAKDAHYEIVDDLRAAGLDEAELRAMEPDERVEALERAHLDPYDYIYLAC